MVTRFIDSNILAWYLNKNSPNHNKVRDYLNPLIRDPINNFLINEFVVLEVFHYLIKRLGSVKGKNLALKFIKYKFITIEYSIKSQKSLTETLDILTSYGVTTTIGGRDSSIIYTMNQQNVSKIISNDQGFQKVNGIELEDPLT